MNDFYKQKVVEAGFALEEKDVTPGMRRVAKIALFGYMYGSYPVEEIMAVRIVDLALTMEGYKKVAK